MNKLLLPTLLLISTISFGQARLGYTKGQLIDTYETPGTKHHSIILEDDTECIFTQLVNGNSIYHYFDKTTHLSKSAAFLFDKKDRDYIILLCDTNYTKVTKNHWTYKTMDITLKKDQNGQYEYLWFYTR